MTAKKTGLQKISIFWIYLSVIIIVAVLIALVAFFCKGGGAKVLLTTDGSSPEPDACNTYLEENYEHLA